MEVFEILEIRRVLITADDTLIEAGLPANQPALRLAAIAVIKNPLVGRYEEDLQQLVDMGETLGQVLAEKMMTIVEGMRVSSIAKAAIVGTDGEFEHAAALIHHKFALSVSSRIGDVSEVLPSRRAQGGPGALLSIPLADSTSRPAASGNADAIEIRVQGSPQPDEIVVALAVSCNSATMTSDADSVG